MQISRIDADFADTTSGVTAEMDADFGGTTFGVTIRE